MDFFTTLLTSYEKAEEQGLVDDQSQDTILLPIYHTDYKSKGTDTIVIELTTTGNLISVYEIPKGQRIIFPIKTTETGNTSTNHPLSDKLKNIKKNIDDNQYITNWLNYENDPDIHTFINAIQTFINQPDFEKQLTNCIGNTNIITDNTYIEFAIPNFKNYKTYSVSNYKELHQSYINFVDYYNKKHHPDQYRTCIISGKKERILGIHRLLTDIGGGTGKLICISSRDKRKEMFTGNYFGTNKDSLNAIAPIGQKTSDKIHLMLKYLINNANSCYSIDKNNKLLIWSDSTTKNTTAPNSLLSILGLSSKTQIKTKETQIKPNRTTKTILNSFYKGQNNIDKTNYHIAIIYSYSKGRVGLKYFETIEKSQLFENLQKWTNTYQWIDNKFTVTPSFFNIINDAFAQDHHGDYLELSKSLDTYCAQLHESLLSALLNGQPIPAHILKRIEQNLKYPKRYPKQWRHLVNQGLALLNRKDYQPMIDNSETNRSYLFGRLLAVYERIEATKYSLDENKNPQKTPQETPRETNAQRLWTTCINRPERILKNLRDKIKPYNDYLYRKHRGMWTKLNKEESEILTLLDTHRQSPDFNKPLTVDYLFGYQAEKNFIFKKQTESEK